MTMPKCNKKIFSTVVGMVVWLYKNPFKGGIQIPGLIVILLLTGSVQAQDSLNQYIQITTSKNPEVLQKFYEYQSALQKVPQAGSLSDPELSTGIFLSPMELVSGRQVASIRLMQMFPWFGVLRNGRDEMSLMAKASYESFLDTKFRVAFELQRTWNDCYSTRKKIELSEKELGILETIERLETTKFRAGSKGVMNQGSSSSGSMQAGQENGSAAGSSGMEGMSGNQGSVPAKAPSLPQPGMGGSAMSSGTSGTSLTDIYLLQSESAGIKNKIDQLRNEEERLKAKLNSYLNRPADFPVALPDTLPFPAFVNLSLTRPDSMLANHPMLQMLKYEKQSLEARKKMVAGMGYPMAGLGLDYSLISRNGMSTSKMNGKDMIMPMVTVTLPVYRKKYRAMETEVSLEQTATDNRYQAMVNSLTNEFSEALQLYRDSKLRMDLADLQISLAEKTLGLMQRDYSVAGTNLTEILQVEQRLLGYRSERSEALSGYCTAIAWLRRLGAYSTVQ